MRIIDFVREKEEKHHLNETLVEYDFGYHPFFNFVKKTLEKKGKTFNNGVFSFSIQAQKDDLEDAWAVIYKKYKRYFSN